MYMDYNAWDYTLYITNNTDKTTGVFSDLMQLICTLKEMTYHKRYHKGLARTCIRLMSCLLMVTFAESTSGRPTHGVFPISNLNMAKVAHL